MANTAKSTTPSRHCMSTDNPKTNKFTIAQIARTEKLTATDPDKTAKKNSHSGQVYIFITSAILTSVAIGASLFALVTPSCDEGALSVKLWAFEYQLTKKGSCSTLAK